MRRLAHESAQRAPQEIVLGSALPEREGVLAATLDGVIHVSREASQLSKRGLDRLIAHETVHVAQQQLRGPPGTRSQLEHEARSLEPRVLANMPFRPLIPASPATVLRDELTIGTDAADQRQWVSRVDDIIRVRFNLGGVRRRMTDPRTVRFQDMPTFASGFGRSPRDLLIELFAENLSEESARIRIFHGVRDSLDPAEVEANVEQFVDANVSSGFRYWNHEALDWTDYGLPRFATPRPRSSFERVDGNPDEAIATLTQPVTQAQADAAVASQPGVRFDPPSGRGWSANPEERQFVTFFLQVPISRVTHQVSAGELLGRNYAGVTTHGTRGSPRIRIRSDADHPAFVSTLVHEACHFYNHANFRSFVDEIRSARTTHTRAATPLPGTTTARLAPILDEGFTEYFARMVMREQTATLGSPGTGAYPDQYDGARRIIELMTPPQAAESAYFHGIAADIQKVRDGILRVEQIPATVLSPGEPEAAHEEPAPPERSREGSWLLGDPREREDAWRLGDPR